MNYESGGVFIYTGADVNHVTWTGVVSPWGSGNVAYPHDPYRQQYIFLYYP